MTFEEFVIEPRKWFKLEMSRIEENKDGDKWWQFGSIFSIKILEDGNVEFAEECDYWHKKIESKEDAIAILEDAIRFIKS